MTEDTLNPASLPSVIPVFPLDGVILMPGCELPLHIFEPRYRQMVEDTWDTHKIIGMIQPKAFHGSSGQKDTNPGLYTVGGAGLIEKLTPLEDGRYLISLRGVQRFRLLEELSVTTPYRQVVTKWLPQRAGTLTGFDRATTIKRLHAFLNQKDLAADFSQINDMPDDVFIDNLSMAMPFEPAEKQALIEAETINSRAEIFTSLLKMASDSTLLEMPN